MWRMHTAHCGAAVMVALVGVGPDMAHAADCNWTVKGTLKVEHRLSELKTAYGTSPLQNVEVKVSAKERVPVIGWGTWNGWPTVRTRSDGSFTVTNTKNCDQRRFKVEVQFKDDDLEVRHEHSTSSVDKVKWYTIIDESSGEHAAGTTDYGDETFRASGAHDLNDDEAWSHADIWFLYKKAIAKAASYGSDYAFTTQVKVKYPHNSDIARDDVEASYANPSTKVIYIFRSNDGREDHFTVDTLLHEMGHIWAYNHTSGEICLTETLLLHGDTHGLVDDGCVSFHEGWAEFYADEMERALLGGTKKLPFSRPELNRAGGSVASALTSKSLMQRHDDGWWSVFHTLSTPALFIYKFGTPTDTTPRPTIEAMSVAGVACPSPNVSFKDVMSVFNAGGVYANKLSRSETTINSFLDRAAGRLGNLSDPHRDTIKTLVDPASTVQPLDELCR
jgi:hypothetical protein